MKPIAGLPSFPEFANINPGVAPGEPKYSQGFVPADTFPAEWANYLFNRSSKSATALNDAVSSIWAELGSVLSNFNITPDDTKDNQVMEALTKLKAEAALAAHPVGSLYWTSVNENPATTFGGGTWEQIKDKFILAAGDTYSQGSTGGSATVTLTSAQMPVHTHTMESAGNHSHTTDSLKNKDGTADIKNTAGMSAKSSGWFAPQGFKTYSDTDGSVFTQTSGNYYNYAFSSAERNSNGARINMNIEHTHNMEHTHTTNTTGAHTHTINNAGGSSGTTQAHNNMPPYIVQYCWKRTA